MDRALSGLFHHPHDPEREVERVMSMSVNRRIMETQGLSLPARQRLAFTRLRLDSRRKRLPQQKGQGQGQVHPAELMKSCRAAGNVKENRSGSPSSSSESTFIVGSSDSPMKIKKNANSTSSPENFKAYCRH
jgi:hypothetical protein